MENASIHLKALFLVSFLFCLFTTFLTASIHLIFFKTVKKTLVKLKPMADKLDKEHPLGNIPSSGIVSNKLFVFFGANFLHALIAFLISFFLNNSFREFIYIFLIIKVIFIGKYLWLKFKYRKMQIPPTE